AARSAEMNPALKLPAYVSSVSSRIETGDARRAVRALHGHVSAKSFSELSGPRENAVTHFINRPASVLGPFSLRRIAGISGRIDRVTHYRTSPSEGTLP